MNSTDRIPALIEEADVDLADDPEVVTEADIDWVAELQTADEEAIDHRSELEWDAYRGQFYYDDERAGRRSYITNHLNRGI